MAIIIRCEQKLPVISTYQHRKKRLRKLYSRKKYLPAVAPRKISLSLLLQLLLLLLLLRRPIPASDPADDRRPLFDELSECADGDGHIEFWPTPDKPNIPELDAETAAAAANNVSRSRRSAIITTRKTKRPKGYWTAKKNIHGKCLIR